MKRISLQFPMGTSLWTVFCGDRAGFGIAESHLAGFWVIFNPFSCTNHGVIIGADILFTCFSLYLLLRKQTSSSDTSTSGQFRKILSVSSAVFNGCLSISYLAFGVWFLVDKLTEGESLSPLHEWLVILFQGLSWLPLTLTLCLKKNPFTSPFTMKIWSILALVYACFLCIPSLWFSVAYKEVSVKLVADVLSLPGSVLLLLLAFFKSRPEYDGNDGLLEPLLEGTEEENEENVSPFAKAGVLSKLTFWWLNPLMKKGKEKTIEDDDIPQLRSEDRARTCYSVFTQMLNRKRKASEAVANSLPILSTIFSWQSKPILTTAFFALIKVLATSASPLLLKEFIEVAEGNKSFANEGYLLTATLFLVKCIESLSERQWLFRTRIIGIQIRSALSAAIYQKQLRLSSSSSITSSEIVSLVTIDAYRIGEFPASFHQMWTTSLQLCLALLILYYCIGLGAVAAIIVVLLTLVGNSPLAKLQTKYRRKFMEKQDRMVQYIAESLSTMKVLKLYAWEMHFKRVIEGLRQDEYEWIKAVSLQRGYNLILFWAAPVLVPIAAFGACYFLGIELTNAKVFTFLASLRLVQEPVRQLPDVVGAFIDAKVALSRIVGFLEAPEIQRSSKVRNSGEDVAICINAKGISWEDERGSVRPNLRDIKLIVRRGEKVAVCGEVGAGKSTLLASILGEVPYVDGSVQANGSLAYVSQNAWIQTGTIQDNILFGSPMDATRYQEALSKCSLTKDLEMLPYGDLTVIGERGVNLSGGQKQRIQLARALYQNADIYLLDDPFSAVDAHTATSLFTEYVMEALAEKTLLLVTHQVDFLPAFNSILLMSDGKIQATSTYHQLLATSDAFNSFVHAHHDSNSVGGLEIEISKISAEPEIQTTTAAAQQLILGDQLIQKEAKDTGDTGYKPYLDYLRHGKGFLYFALASCIHAFFILGQFAQNVWLAVNLQSSSTSQLVVVEVYALIGCGLIVFLVGRSIFIVLLGLGASKSIFSVLINSLFKAPMFFYDSTPLGRILSRVSSDLSTVDIDIPMRMTIALGTTMNSYLCLCILAVLSWEVVFLIIPLVYLAILLQILYYFSAAKELMRINGTTKSTLSSHAAETAAGNITIRAFGKEDKFFAQNLDLIDKNASPYLHSFAANEWLIQRLDLICTIVLSATALFMTVIQDNTSSGFVGMALSYGLSLNMFLTTSVQSQCTLANMMVSVERLEQYMHIPSEAPEIIATNRPSPLWPNAGRVEILNLKVRYRPNSPLVLKGISCVIEGGHKVGIVGRTGSGKTTLISTLFRLVEPTEGHIIIDGLDISTIGLHDLRSCFGVIPQDPTLFGGSVRYNLDPLHEHTDHEIWQVLEKCQLREAVKEKSEGLSSFVVQDGSNWSMGQRQLFCLGRALLKKRKILVLDEATASIDNATDAIIQRAIRTEFDSSTVITVAHRIPTVLDSTMVLAMSDGRLVEYDEPSKLMNEETSMFGQLVREYWAQTGNAATG